MPTPEDRAFFESLNKDLAKNIGESIKGAFKESDKGKGKGKEDGDDGVRAAKIATILGHLNKTIGSLMSLVGQNVSNVAAYGDTIARTAVATNQTTLFQTQKIAGSTQFLTDEFGKFGFNLREVGGMLSNAMLQNVRGISVNTQRFIARTRGFNTSMGSVAKFLQTQTNVLGNDIESTNTLGHIMQDVARGSGIVATAMFEAVNAFTENTRTLKAVYGGEVGEQFQTALGSLVGTIGVGFEKEVKGLVSALAPTDFEGMRKITILGRSIGAGDLSPEAMRADPAGHLVKAITALARIAQEADAVHPGDEFSRGKFIEQRMVALGISINQMGIAQRLMQNAQARGQSLATFMTPGGMTDAERALDSAKAQEDITGHSQKAADALKDFAIETGATTIHYKMLQLQSELTRDALYMLEDGAVNTKRKLLGMAAASVGVADKIMKYVNPITDILMSIALFRGLRGRAAGGGGGGAGWGAGFRTLPTASKTKFPGAVHQKLGQPRGGRWVHPSQTSMATAQGRASLGLGKGGGLKSLGRAARIPGIGGIIAGGLEYAENKDVSRAVTAGAAAGVGGWAGFGLGMAAGTLFGPAAVVMSPLLGILGAMGGGSWLSKQAVDIHDKAGYFEGSEINAEKASMYAANQVGTELIVIAVGEVGNKVLELKRVLVEDVASEMEGTRDYRGMSLEQRAQHIAGIDDLQRRAQGDLSREVGLVVTPSNSALTALNRGAN
jgi:hypothetical protein